jgi:hypothetical protein
MCGCLVIGGTARRRKFDGNTRHLKKQSLLALLISILPLVMNSLSAVEKSVRYRRERKIGWIIDEGETVESTLVAMR